ncbi:MAG: hypothetical protein ACRD0P_20440, partial [Stackebrandtia sp.]
SVSTAQLVRLMRFFATRWTIGDANGRVVPHSQDLAELFSTAERFGFDPETLQYSADGETVAHVVHRNPAAWRRWRSRITSSPETLPRVLEVRDSLLRTRWVITKPDAAWRTAFYVTDRHGNRVGTVRPTSVVSHNLDLCGTDNQVLATLQPGEPRTTIVDTHGTAIAVWYSSTGDLFSHADPALRPLCLLSPIVLRFVKRPAIAEQRPDDSVTVPQPADATQPAQSADPAPPADPQPVVTRPVEPTPDQQAEPATVELPRDRD